MESYEESVKVWENYAISDADKRVLMMEMYKNSRLKMNYDFILKQEAALIKKICDDRTTFVRVFAVYYFLLWNGFFSNNKHFEFNKSSNCIEYMPGLSVILGNGVCFNIASHFRDLLKYITNEYHGYVVGVHLEENHQWNSKHSEIKKNTRIFSNSLSSESDLLNHANVLIIDKNDIYMLDPTNFLIYNVLECDKDNNLPTRIELRVHINLESAYVSESELKSVVKCLKKLNDDLANREYKRCGVDILSKTLNTGVNLCQNHMQDILEFRKKYGHVYDIIALSMAELSKQIKNKVRVLK